jgi:hypothetical protein
MRLRIRLAVGRRKPRPNAQICSTCCRRQARFFLAQVRLMDSGQARCAFNYVGAAPGPTNATTGAPFAITSGVKEARLQSRRLHKPLVLLRGASTPRKQTREARVEQLPRADSG